MGHATAIAMPRSGVPTVTSFRPGALLGDSITGQHAAFGTGNPWTGSQGPWNWANWLVGAPFDLDFIAGVSGAVAVDIFARAWTIPPTIPVVFVIAGTNDVLAVSSSANLAARDAAVTAITGTIAAGLAALRSVNKVIAISTIPPNNAYTAGDSRIDVLDRVNAYIATTVSLGLADAVMDLFTATWDSTAPTTRVYKTGYSNDGTHLTNLAGYTAGASFISSMQNLYAISSGASSWFDQLLLPCQQFSTMRVISGISSTISTGGSGTAATDMAAGWRSLRNAGTPTWVCSIVDRTTPTNWVGPMAVMGGSEKMQKYVITATAASDVVRTQLATALAANSSAAALSFGDTIAFGAEVMVESPVNLTQTKIETDIFNTAGTAPADQPYGTISTATRAKAGLSSVAGTEYPYVEGYRAYMRTRRVRLPENVNGTVALSGQLYMDAAFNAAGSSTIYWGRPQLFRWCA